MSTLYILFECASGFGIFERIESDDIGQELPEVQRSIMNLGKFSKIMKLKSFIPFTSAEMALDNIQHCSEGEITPFLQAFLEQTLPSVASDLDKSNYSLGVSDSKIGNIIQETMRIRCVNNDMILELQRGIRLHLDRFIKGLRPGDMQQAQLGLGHSYSRAKVKFNVNKVDNMIIQSIAILDQLDKDLNTFAMRVREWYSWHFPELLLIVNDNYKFCRLVKCVGNKTSLATTNKLPELVEICEDEQKAQKIIDAAKMSMGTDISDIDMLNIDQFATRVIKLGEYKTNLHEYLISKMDHCAPNLAALVGEHVGARLISHAGSLTNLAKYPASTVQILGAEKALFRALKTRGNTPKYGLIYHSTFIGRAATKNKGRISRYLANKCSIASRIDAFSDVTTSSFGLKLREQVEERLEFYKTGEAPSKNITAMKDVISSLGGDVTATTITNDVLMSDPIDVKDDNNKKKKKKKKKKRTVDEMETTTPETTTTTMATDEGEGKKKKKKKKKKHKANPKDE